MSERMLMLKICIIDILIIDSLPWSFILNKEISGMTKENDARDEENGHKVFKLKNFKDVKLLDIIGGVSFLLQKWFKLLE